MDLHDSELAAPAIVPEGDIGGDLAPSLARRTTHGFLWLLLQGLSGRAGSLLSQLVLARLLLPQAFGEIGLALTVTSLVNAVIAFGIDDILLQRHRTMRLWVAPAFWSALGLALLGAALMVGAAPVAARIYSSPGLTGLVAVAAINLPVSALFLVPEVKLRAALNFRFLGAYASIETLTIQLAVVLCAALGFGAYSFVAPLPVAAAIKSIIFWRKAPVYIGARPKLGQFRYLIGSGLLVQASRIVIEAVNQGDYIVLGLLASAHDVGMYFFAFRLAAQPLRMLAGNVGNVLFSALTQLRAEPARQVAAALRASRVLAFTVTPVCFMQAALAQPALHLLFGAKWNGAIPLMQALSIGLPGDATAWISGALLVANGQFRRDLRYLAAFAVPFFICVVIGAHIAGPMGVAVGVALYYALLKPVQSWMIFRGAVDGREFIQIYVLPPVLAGVAFGTPMLLNTLPALEGNDLLQAIVVLGLGSLLYIGLLLAFAPLVAREMMERFPVHAALGRFMRRPRWTGA
jgi:PST family polysaccharide transporter